MDAIRGFKDQSRAQAKSANNTATPSTQQLDDGTYVGLSDEIDRGGRKDRQFYGEDNTAVWASDYERNKKQQEELRATEAERNRRDEEEHKRKTEQRSQAIRDQEARDANLANNSKVTLRGFVGDDAKAQAEALYPRTRQLRDGSWVGEGDEVDHDGRKDKQLHGAENTMMWESEYEQANAQHERQLEAHDKPKGSRPAETRNAQQDAAESARRASHEEPGHDESGKKRKH